MPSAPRGTDGDAAPVGRRRLFRRACATAALPNLGSPVPSHPLATVVEASTLTQDRGDRRRILECPPPATVSAISASWSGATTPTSRPAQHLEPLLHSGNFLFGTPLASHPAVRYWRRWSTPCSTVGSRRDPHRARQSLGWRNGGRRSLRLSLRETCPSWPGRPPSRPVVRTVHRCDRGLERLDMERELAQASKWAGAPKISLNSLISFNRKLANTSGACFGAVPSGAWKPSARSPGDRPRPGARPGAPFADFWRQFQSFSRRRLFACPTPRDVVHVMDFMRAPVGAAGGLRLRLLEKEFPATTSGLPLSDASAWNSSAAASTPHHRRPPARGELPVRTGRQPSHRATAAQLPKFNSKGEDNLRSFLLDQFLYRDATRLETGSGSPLAPRRPATPPPPRCVTSLLRTAWPSARSLGPTSVEAYPVSVPLLRRELAASSGCPSRRTTAWICRAGQHCPRVRPLGAHRRGLA